jgi:RNA polymerase sigma-70 factor (ECF subfamily)
MVGLNDKLLLYKIRAKKDPDAFAEFYDENVERIYRFIYFKISHKEEAEDLTANVFLKAWNYLIDESNKEVKNLVGLLYGISRNLIIDWYRSRAQKQELVLDEVVEMQIEPVNKNQLYDALDAKAEVTNLLKIIKTLKQDYQEILLLRFIEGLSMSEVAEITNKSQISVRVTAHRAVKKLKELMENNK